MNAEALLHVTHINIALWVYVIYAAITALIVMLKDHDPDKVTVFFAAIIIGALWPFILPIALWESE